MPRLSMIPTFLREIACPRSFPREPEPAMVMDGAAEVAAYTEAGRIDGVMAAAYLFLSARVSQVIQGCRYVVDLGCGPAPNLPKWWSLTPISLSMGSICRPPCWKAQGRISGNRD